VLAGDTRAARCPVNELSPLVLSNFKSSLISTVMARDPIDDQPAQYGRPKLVRDIVSGLTVLAFMAWGAPRGVGIILLVEAVIPVGDMLLILAAKGAKKAPSAFTASRRCYGLGSHPHDDWCVLRRSMLFQSGYSLPGSLAQASSTRSARPGRKVISRGGASRAGGAFLLVDWR
jgi:Domain of unknown function (DUF4267)